MRPIPSILVGATCVIAAAAHGQGQVVGWGSNLNGELRLVTESLLPFTSVRGGAFHTVALRADGTVACWGSNVLAQGTPPSDLGPVKLIDAGSFFSVAVRTDGTVSCWGNNNSGQCTVPSGLVDVRSISAGDQHVVALQSNGLVRAWGQNASGQCNVPTQPSLGSVVEVAAGGQHSMALRADGSVLRDRSHPAAHR